MDDRHPDINGLMFIASWHNIVATLIKNRCFHLSGKPATCVGPVFANKIRFSSIFNKFKTK